MASLIPRFLLISKSVHNFNGLHNIQSYTKCIRQMHLVHTRQFSIVSSQLLALASAKHSPIASSPFNYNSLRFKHNKRGGKHRHSDDESGDDDDDNDDDDSSNLNDFKEGNSSDRNLARVKTKSLRLDAVINAGLGISKNQIEKLFYSSAIRVDGKKVTKKGMDILRECEIDVIKGPSPDNLANLLVNRIEVLQVKSEGLFFVITMRRQKNLAVENYELKNE